MILFGKFLVLAGKKEKTRGAHNSRGEAITMSVSAITQKTNIMQFDLNLSGPTVIDIYDEENIVIKPEKSAKEEMVFKAEKGENSGCLSGEDPREGTRNSTILVTPLRKGRQGSKSEPICLEDEIEVIGDCMHPIIVDDYENGGTPEEVSVEFAIKGSLLDLDCFEVGPFDLKGKRVKIERECRLRRPIQEVGESSNPPLPKPDSYCSICMESKFKYECFALKNCSHVYCSSCVSQYVEAKVEDNVTSIRCPDPSCKDGYLEPEMCQSILKPEVFNRWGHALCEAMIGMMKFYCPFKDCSALLMDERFLGEVIMESECPHCFRLFCAQCKVPWHSGLDCAEFANLGAEEREREDIMLRNMAKQSHWQRCPMCNFYVERISGCMFIKCR